MAVAVVHGLEVVDVDHRNAKPPPFPSGQGKELLRLLLEGTPVVKGSQRVVGCHLCKLPFLTLYHFGSSPHSLLQLLG